MKADTEKAKALLAENGYTFAAVSETDTLTAAEHGVKPLLSLIREGKSLQNYCAADQIVGRAAAFLYARLAPTEIYACVISRAGLETLEKYNIPVYYGEMTEQIRNRQNTDICPMEKATEHAESPEEATERILEAIRRMQNKG